jgi:mono/diheme cytochrome c family protein
VERALAFRWHIHQKERLMMKNSTSFLAGAACLTLLVASATAQDAAKWTVPASASQKTNPVAGKASAIAEGKKLFVATCVACHGNTGKGDGPAAAALTPKPANFADSRVRQESDGALFWKLSEGHGPMPPWKQAFTETQRWDLVSFIRTIAPRK